MKNFNLVFRQTDQDLFNEIAQGIKTVETRAATEKYKAIQQGDTLTFVCGKDTLTKEILKVSHFKSLEELFDTFPLSDVLPSVTNLEDAKAVYYSFPNYKEKIEKEGILAFTLAN